MIRDYYRRYRQEVWSKLQKLLGIHRKIAFLVTSVEFLIGLILGWIVFGNKFAMEETFKWLVVSLGPILITGLIALVVIVLRTPAVMDKGRADKNSELEGQKQSEIDRLNKVIKHLTDRWEGELVQAKIQIRPFRDPDFGPSKKVGIRIDNLHYQNITDLGIELMRLTGIFDGDKRCDVPVSQSSAILNRPKLDRIVARRYALLDIAEDRDGHAIFLFDEGKFPYKITKSIESSEQEVFAFEIEIKVSGNIENRPIQGKTFRGQINLERVFHNDALDTLEASWIEMSEIAEDG